MQEHQKNRILTTLVTFYCLKTVYKGQYVLYLSSWAEGSGEINTRAKLFQLNKKRQSYEANQLRIRRHANYLAIRT